MAGLQPFHAVTYTPDVAGPAVQTSAPPYSDLGPYDYAAHRTANPYTVLELLSVDGEGTSQQRHASAAATLGRWLRTGVLDQTTDPVMAVYEQRDRDGAGHRGIVAALDLRSAEDGTLLVHEDVDPQRVKLRAARLRHVPIDLTPVVTVHLGAPAEVRRIVDEVVTQPPAVAMEDEAQAVHRLWVVDDPDRLRVIIHGMAAVQLVLADGHHRLAAAIETRQRARRIAREDGRPLPDHPPGGGWDVTLAMLCDAVTDGPALHAVHRLIRCSHPDPLARLEGVDALTITACSDAEALERAVAEVPAASGQPPQVRRFGLLTLRGAWLVEAPRDFGRALLAELDVPEELREVDMVTLQTCLYPTLGVYDEEPVSSVARALPRLQPDADGHGPLSVGPADALVLLAPPPVEQVFGVAGAGLRMPAKTTWFSPKPRAGLVMRLAGGLGPDGA